MQREFENFDFLSASRDNGAMSVTYSQAGVSIVKGDRVTEAAKHAARVTRRKEVVAGVGGFGAMFRIPAGYRQPLIVSATDGVGTKLRVALMMKRHDTIGIDLVAMNVNDILTLGAEPLTFLDYYVTDRIQPNVTADVLKGIAEGCKQAGCALIGGETAEHPGCFMEGEYDLAGFAVGVVEETEVIDGKKIVPGDVVLGLPSSGVHSNGFSLIRKVCFDIAKLSVKSRPTGLGKTLGEELLTPTRIYKRALSAIPRGLVKGMAHITGGGITGNLPRVLPKGCEAHIQLGSWPVPPIFQLLQDAGRISGAEMRKTFNMGVGMILVVSAGDADRVTASLRRRREAVYRIGEIAKAPRGVEPRVVY